MIIYYLSPLPRELRQRKGLDKNPLFSERAQHYNIFREVTLILFEHIQINLPLSLETKLNIVEKAYNMNKKGKRRVLSKDSYIKLLYNFK